MLAEDREQRMELVAATMAESSWTRNSWRDWHGDVSACVNTRVPIFVHIQLACSSNSSGSV